MAASDVIYLAVVSLTDHGVDTSDILIPFLAESVGQNPLDALSHGQGVGQHNWGLNGSKFLDLSYSSQFPEAVADKYRGWTFLSEKVALMGDNGRHPGPDIIAFDDSHLADLDSRHIRYGIQRTGLEYSRLNTEVPDPAPTRGLGKGSGADDHKRQGCEE